MNDCYIKKNHGGSIITGSMTWDATHYCTCSDGGLHRYPCLPVLPTETTEINWQSVSEINLCARGHGGYNEVEAAFRHFKFTCSRIMACTTPCGNPGFVHISYIVNQHTRCSNPFNFVGSTTCGVISTVTVTPSTPTDDCYIKANIGAETITGSMTWDATNYCICSSAGVHKYPCLPVFPTETTEINWKSVSWMVMCGGNVERDAQRFSTLCKRIMACTTPCGNPGFVDFTNIVNPSSSTVCKDSFNFVGTTTCGIARTVTQTLSTTIPTTVVTTAPTTVPFTVEKTVVTTTTEPTTVVTTEPTTVPFTVEKTVTEPTTVVTTEPTTVVTTEPTTVVVPTIKVTTIPTTISVTDIVPTTVTLTDTINQTISELYTTIVNRTISVTTTQKCPVYTEYFPVIKYSQYNNCTCSINALSSSSITNQIKLNSINFIRKSKSNNTEESSKLSTGAIAGLTSGVVVATGIISTIIFKFLSNKVSFEKNNNVVI